MKNTIKTLLAGLLLFIPAVGLRAQTNQDADASNSVIPMMKTTKSAPAPASTYAGGSGGPFSVSKPPDAHFLNKDVIALVLTFGMPVAIVGLTLFFKYRRDRMAHETLRAMVEKGVPITPELVAQLGSKHPDASKPSNHSRHLLPGLVMVAVGAALLVSNHAGVGAIPGFPGGGSWIILFVGVAFLVVWLVERNNKNDAQPPRQ